MQINNKKTTNIYKRANLFWDTYTFVPIFIINLILVYFLIIKNFKTEFLIIFFVLFPFLLYGYIRSIIKIKKYNMFINNSSIVDGYIEEIIFINIEQYGRAKVDVKYKYTDPFGVDRFKEEEVYLFPWETPYSRQMIKWKQLYYKSKKISILIKNNDYNVSYLPMREDYCKMYKKLMSINFYRHL